MPYVAQSRRPELDKVVRAMADARVCADGDLNYILYAYCVRHVPKSYEDLKNLRAELREAADEIGRRLLAPYENKKIQDNGDVT